MLKGQRCLFCLVY